MFVAINFISCIPSYRERFEELFATRAHAIDKMPGFLNMMVLKPKEPSERYLIVSHWRDEASFKAWSKSPEFLEGHARGFADLQAAKTAGTELPMNSRFLTYEVIAE